MSKQKILITGSSGTIGTALLKKLLGQGYEVVGFDKKQNQWDSELNKRTIKGDLLRDRDLKKLPKRIDLIIHLAASAQVGNSVLNPVLALENMAMTLRMLEFARKQNIPRFIFSSSRDVYGNTEEVSSEDNVGIRLVESPYAASKLASEALISAYGKCFGIRSIVLRFSNVYGRYDVSDRFFPLIMKKMLKNQDVFLYGKEKVLDFLYIDDCVHGIMQSIVQFSKAQNTTFNIANGKSNKLSEAISLLKKLLGSKSKISIKPNRKGEVMHFIADISKAKSLLGYKPTYSIERGIELGAEWYARFYQEQSL